MSSISTAGMKVTEAQSFDLAYVSDDELLDAIRTVITFTIADVFVLTEEEVMWSTYHINEALQAFRGSRRNLLPSNVKHEMTTSLYSHKLEEHLSKNPQPSTDNGTVKQADVIDWATVLTDVALSTFNARPIIATGFVGKIAGLLTELGVGNKDYPRASRYLPTAIRSIMR